MSSSGNQRYAAKRLAFETEELRRGLDRLFATSFPGTNRKVGQFNWGVYAFFDYDREPIYVGQTKEGLSTRIRRHLTNQRTDAVAMNVLDPFEVFGIEVWPLGELQAVSQKKSSKSDYDRACEQLNVLEYAVWERARLQSTFHAILNEKDPLDMHNSSFSYAELPPSYRGVIVSPKVDELRGHADVRIARRALTISRLAQVVVERQVSGGLRQTLVTQARRLAHLANERFNALGGQAIVEKGAEDEPTPDDEESDGA